MKKRLLSIVLALALALSLVPAAFASGAVYTLGTNIGTDRGVRDGVRVFDLTVTVGTVVNVPVASLTSYSGSLSYGQNNLDVVYSDPVRQQIVAKAPGTAWVDYSRSVGTAKRLLLVNVTVLSADENGSTQSSTTSPSPADTSAEKHDWHIQVVKAPTCKETGYEQEMCSICGALRGTITVLPKTNHTWEKKSIAATCFKEGKNWEECSVCKATRNTEMLPRLGHKYTSIITKQPTGSQPGVRTYTCTVCGNTYTESIPVTGNNSNPGTSTNPGTTKPETPHTHQYETKVIKAPTCKSTGTSQEVCSICSAVRSGSTKTISKTTDHTWEEKTTPATCTNTGSSWQQCSVCGTRRNQKIIPKTDHSYVEGAIVRQPTVTRTGERVDRCSVCGTAKYVELPKKEEGALGPHTSGSYAMSKLSQGEIRQLLSANPVTPPSGSAFDSSPSCAAPYSTGKVKDSVLQAALNRLNALRKLAGLPAVALDSSLNENAQYGAVIIAAMGELSHTPPKQSGMSEEFYKEAYSACASSNLAAGRDLVGSIDMWMDDTDRTSVGALGHRRWQLNPGMGKTGFGYATRSGSRYNGYAAEKSFDSSAPAFDYDFIGWPASGNFPSDLFGGYVGWSVSLNPEKYQAPSKSQVKVTLTRKSDGKVWTSGSNLYFEVDRTGYGVKNCIIFRPDGISKYEGLYTVQIDGLKTLGGKPVADFSYDVEFFDLTSASAQMPDETQKPGDTQQPGTSTQNPGTGKQTFSDVPAGVFFTEPVAWAVEKGVTNGTTTTTFSPYEKCTQVQILTFLWRAAGKPASDTALPINITGKNIDYAEGALRWAAENKMIDRRFVPGTPCTRASAVTYIWQAFGSPEEVVWSASDGWGGSNFTDVPANSTLADAVSWAVAEEVTNGTSKTTFSPNDICNRGQIVTFLYRAYH